MADGNARDLGLIAIGQRVTAVYEPVVEALQTLRISAREFEQGVSALETASTSQGRDNGPAKVVGLASALGDLDRVISQALRTIGAPEAQSSLHKLVSLCGVLKNIGRELNALSSVMLVTAANVHGEHAIRDLVAELRALSVNLRAEIAEILQVIGQVKSARDTTLSSLSTAERVVAAQRQDAASTAAEPDIARDSPRGTGTDLHGLAARLSASVSGEMPTIVACMQHPDAFSQRCAHVSDILQRRDDLPAESGAHAALTALCIAQVEDQRVELESVQKSTCAALREIAEASDRIILAFETSLERDTRIAQMAVRRDRLTQTRDAIETIKTDTDAALSYLEECQAVFGGMAAALERFNGMRKAVAMSSINADLSERQAKKNAPEMRALTRAIGESAQTCGTAIQDLEKAIKTLETSLSGEDRAQISTALEKTCDHLDAASGDLQDITQKVDAFRTAQENCRETLKRLVAAATAAESRIASNTRMLDMLADVSDALKDQMDGAGPGAHELPDQTACAIFDTYTIEREREVHRRVLGQPAEGLLSEPSTGSDGHADAEDPSEDDDPLAAVLF